MSKFNYRNTPFFKMIYDYHTDENRCKLHGIVIPTEVWQVWANIPTPDYINKDFTKFKKTFPFKLELKFINGRWDLYINGKHNIKINNYLCKNYKA